MSYSGLPGRQSLISFIWGLTQEAEVRDWGHETGKEEKPILRCVLELLLWVRGTKFCRIYGKVHSMVRIVHRQEQAPGVFTHHSCSPVAGGGHIGEDSKAQMFGSSVCRVLSSTRECELALCPLVWWKACD